MDDVWIEYIPWVYAAIQGAITLTVSIIGVKYVRNEFLIQKNRAQQPMELQIDITKNNNHNLQSTDGTGKKKTVSNESNQQKNEMEQFEV